MKLSMFILLTVISSVALSDQYVHGYTKRNGTYVEPYHRSSPDHTRSNNYGTQGNYNPYTGQQGTQSQDD